MLWQMPNHVTRCEKIWIEVRECGSGIHEHAGLPFFIPNPQTCTNVLQSLVSLIIRVTTQNHLPISDVYSESIRSVDGLSGRCLLHMFILSDSPSHPCRICTLACVSLSLERCMKSARTVIAFQKPRRLHAE